MEPLPGLAAPLLCRLRQICERERHEDALCTPLQDAAPALAERAGGDRTAGPCVPAVLQAPFQAPAEVQAARGHDVGCLQAGRVQGEGQRPHRQQD